MNGGVGTLPQRDPASMGSVFQARNQCIKDSTQGVNVVYSAGVPQHSTMQGNSDFGRRNYRTPDRHMQETMTSADLNQRMPSYGGPS